MQENISPDESGRKTIYSEKLPNKEGIKKWD